MINLNYRTKKKISKVFLIYIPLALFLIFTLFPFYWYIVTSFKVESSIMQKPMRYLPIPFTFDNYKTIIVGMGFERYFINSLIVGICTTFCVMVVAVLGGYALSRYRFKGKKATMSLMLLTQMLPGVVIMIPLFTIFNKLNLIDNLLSLVLTYVTVNTPFCMIMMRGFYSGIPKTLEEAARIDGCSLMGAVIRVILPTLLPGIITCGSFAFVNAWNEFIYAMIFINNPNLMTLPVAMSMMQGEFTVNYGSLAAGCVISMIPVILVFIYIQKYMVQGLTAGAVKG